ncbi:GlxA family transcriptional regulator [Methylobacterium sp. J-068]|uniref:GlxA family transcriptional regulator n=1 Tax=Methylobacterium sp. J-068 TaxID=2836649 RepID=UPI001FB89EEF|nr:GlxA family transcriptional regulator [Methylobacterium sp. J-068]MCJ2035711.1 GlxA family transcriptional regulator [Methylobacterium sp. J-068]
MTKTPRFLPDVADTPRRIEILAFADVQLLDVAGPLQVFATANDLAAPGRPPYAPRLVAARDGRVRSSAGLDLAGEPLPPADRPLDTLLVAGGRGVTDAAAGDLPGWIAARAPRARRVASVCTGAFLLGAAGLLDGRRAVTHWTHCAELARRYPNIRVEPDPIFIRDGAVWTSAGVTAGIDLALALVEADLGRAAALAVARHLVVFLKRPGGQAQFSTVLALQVLSPEAGAARFEPLHAWIAEHLAEELTVARLAEVAGMSPRGFARHYRAATGLTPARALERLRVEAARGLLAETALPVKRVAERCGFGSEETLRRSFFRHVAVTPAAYRGRFRARGEGAPEREASQD